MMTDVPISGSGSTYSSDLGVTAKRVVNINGYLALTPAFISVIRAPCTKRLFTLEVPRPPAPPALYQHLMTNLWQPSLAMTTSGGLQMLGSLFLIEAILETHHVLVLACATWCLPLPTTFWISAIKSLYPISVSHRLGLCLRMTLIQARTSWNSKLVLIVGNLQRP